MGLTPVTPKTYGHTGEGGMKREEGGRKKERRREVGGKERETGRQKQRDAHTEKKSK